MSKVTKDKQDSKKKTDKKSNDKKSNDKKTLDKTEFDEENLLTETDEDLDQNDSLDDAELDEDYDGLGEDLDDLQGDFVEDSYDEYSDSSNRRSESQSMSTLPAPTVGSAIKVRDSLQGYISEIRRFPLLQPDEEVRLARMVRDTEDPDAAFKMISSHLRLVVRIAMNFQRRWMQNVLDLIQEGNVGLVKAVSKFDPEKGIKFSYYAAFWIKAYILKFIMDNWRMVKIGTTQAQRKLFYNLNKERQKLISNGFDPDTEMLSKSLNVTEEQIIEMEQRMSLSDMSLNLPMNTDEPGGASKMDYLPALGPGVESIMANNEIAVMVQEKLKSLIPELSDKEQFILNSRILTDDPITLREIGEKYNITRERVRQIEARLLQKIRNHLFNNIKDFSQDWIDA